MDIVAKLSVRILQQSQKSLGVGVLASSRFEHPDCGVQWVAFDSNQPLHGEVREVLVR